MLEQEIVDIGFDGIVCSAGSYIELDHQVIDETFIDYDKILEVIDIFKRNDIAFALEGTYATYADDEMMVRFTKAHHGITESSEMQRIRKEVESGMNRKTMKEFYEHPAPIHKITFIAKDNKDLKEPKELLSGEFMFVVHEMFSQENIQGEIIDSHTTKATAVIKILERLQASMEDTIAFGDSMNDFEMIEMVAYGFAMADGSEQLKAIADAICPSAKEDGVYQELKRLRLI
jgi:Cof subfamily protein (haloacid dehalogenase superfamily)